MNELDDVLGNIQTNATATIDEYNKKQAELAEKTRKAKIQNNIKKIAYRKLDFQHRLTFKRNNSFKGRDRDSILPTLDEKDMFKEYMTNPQPPRNKSATRNRELRPLKLEMHIDQNPGTKKQAEEEDDLSEQSDGRRCRD